jgi:hypothetical protein
MPIKCSFAVEDRAISASRTRPRLKISPGAAEVVALRQPATHQPGLHRFFQGATWLWADIFLLLTVGLVGLMFTEPTARLGLRLRFAPA